MTTKRKPARKTAHKKHHKTPPRKANGQFRKRK